MFSRDQSASSSMISTSEQITSEHFFDAIKQKNLAEVKRCFHDRNQKVWQLREENNSTALHRSVFMNSEPMTKLIIEELKKRLGFDDKNGLEKFINERTNEGITALHYAAYNGNIQIATLLIDNGATVELVSNRGKNVMHFAAEGNKPSIMVFFMAYHAQDVFCIDEYGSTPLHWACYSGGEESVLFLLNVKANIDAKDKEGLTPLHLCAISKRDQIAKKLLMKGADKSIKNAKNQTALDIALKNRDKNMILLLQDKEYNPLCTLETPLEKIEPDNSFKFMILGYFIINELLVVFVLIPFILGFYEQIINVVSFVLTVLSFVIIVNKDTAKIEQVQIIKDNPGANPFKVLIDNGIDIITFCSVCCVNNTNSRKHCFVCNKCIEGFDHHCFWLNKCIGRGNLIAYMIFLFFSIVYILVTIYISALCFQCDLYEPDEEKVFPPRWLTVGLIDKKLVILGCAVTFIMSLIVSFPFVCLFMYQLFKQCGLFEIKKKVDRESIKKNNLELNLVEKKTEVLIEEKGEDEEDDRDSSNIGAINRVADDTHSSKVEPIDIHLDGPNEEEDKKEEEKKNEEEEEKEKKEEEEEVKTEVEINNEEDKEEAQDEEKKEDEEE